MRINTLLPEDTLKKIDSIAKEEKISSEKLIEERERLKAERIRRKKLKRAIEIQNRLREKAGKWDGVSEIRKWRELLR